MTDKAKEVKPPPDDLLKLTLLKHNMHLKFYYHCLFHNLLIFLKLLIYLFVRLLNLAQFEYNTYLNCKKDFHGGDKYFFWYQRKAGLYNSKYQ